MIAELTNHLWQSTLFAVAAGLLTLAFRKNRAQVRYWLWFSASVKFLIPFSLLMSLGGSIHWTRRGMPPPMVTLAVAQITQPFSYSVPFVPSTPAFDWTPIALLAVWLCGFAAIVLIRLRSWRRVRAAIHASKLVEIPAPVEIRMSPGLLEPGVVGVFCPILLLPEGIIERLTPNQLNAVLAHELTHVRRRDNLFASIHMAVESIFWFHPLVWWIGARLVEERERACDEAVLAQGNRPHDYAEGILSVCKLYVESPLACVSGVTGSNLKKRIEAIMVNRTGLCLNRFRMFLLAGAGTVALTMPVLVGTMSAPLTGAQSPDAAERPKFEVASIKPCKDEPGRMRGAPALAPSPGRLSTGCLALADENGLGLIQRAYVRFAGGHTNPIGVLPIKGGPAWIHSEFYEINAKAAGSPSGEMAQGPMLQTLLEDRFKLKIHRETTQGPVYALSVARGGAKLKPFIEGNCVQMSLTIPIPTPVSGQRYCMVRIMFVPPSAEAEGSTLTEFSKLLNLVLDRQVIDRTGINGRFNIKVKFSPDQSTPGLRMPGRDLSSGIVSDPTGPTIFTAMQEQLGLKLESSKGPIEALVIDHVEHPSEN